MAGIGLTDYIKPKNDAFTGMVQASQVLGGGGDGTLPDACVAESNVTQHEGAIDHDQLTNYNSAEHFLQTQITSVSNIGTGFMISVAGALGVQAITWANVSKTGSSINDLADVSGLSAITGETGSGNIVRATSPTLSSPTIGDLTNAQHNHISATGGGTLSAGAIQSGTLVHERGGLEADVSAYNGLLRITAGATSAVSLPLPIGSGGTGQDTWGAGISGQLVKMSTDTTMGASGYEVGNSDGNVPLSNGTLCDNLNADMLDGVEGAAYVADSDFGANGFCTRTASGTYANRTLSSNKTLNITNGNGVAGNPTFSVIFDGAIVYASSNHTIANNTWTDLDFDSEDVDTNDYHDTDVAEDHKLTAVQAGKYLLTANVQWDTDGTGARWIAFYLNNATYLAMETSEAIASQADYQCLSKVVNLSLNDYVSLRVKQNSGADRTVTANASRNPFFSIVHLGT